MGSIVISDVVNHFPQPFNNMFGASSHQQHDSSQSQRSTSARPQHSLHADQNTSSALPRASQPIDTPMADVVPHAPAPSTASDHLLQQQHRAPAAHPGLTPQGPGAAQAPSQPPPSPRFKPQSSERTPIQPGPSSSSSIAKSAVSNSSSSSVQASPQSLQSIAGPALPPPHRIKVKSLSHIQSFANDESSPFSQTRAARRARQNPNDIGPQYEISEMPVSDIIEMVAGLLTKITTTNDRQHEHLHRQIPPPEGTSGLSQQTTSVLAFHGKNVPTISILSYLTRIHKYCPTTYEVFLSLLVYFDRMTERVNSGLIQSMRQANQQSLERSGGSSDASRKSSVSMSGANLGTSSPGRPDQVQAATPPPSGSLGKPSKPGDPALKEEQPPSPPQHMDPLLECDPYSLSQFFVVDSFNIHRLVIAGVTCASKFFSDIFYTNSRYAKVGGLPLVELNHLELQFLLLNDFRLAVPLEEMEAYGTMLVEFYGREVVAQQQQPHGGRSLGGAQAGMSA
ncbi:cyclin-domain-containing protein [Phyllosticta citricarpa]|uniref:Cyclin-domain-containing protein n=2 Tax=Phyllosticta TaxID=121621 RepID=A0ABR1LRV2_9PEZI